MKKGFFLVAFLVALSAQAADGFPYDHQLALDLSRAYLRSYARQSPEKSVNLASVHPVLSSAVAAHNRHLVFVTYTANSASAGNYVVLELCAETKLLTVVEAGEVDPISAYKYEIGGITSKTFVASPAVCPEEVP